MTFDTLDLKEAKVLLNSLAVRRSNMSELGEKRKSLARA